MPKKYIQQWHKKTSTYFIMDTTDDLANIFCLKMVEVNVCTGLLPFYCCSTEHVKGAEEICCYQCSMFFDQALRIADRAKSNDHARIELLQQAPWRFGLAAGKI